ncbi:MAG: hypothetical protein JNM72_14665 [Deltaproteobacteria bacterium]|nr:hypothetical protein [Deltaproteobacteria bacterium]
MSALPLLCALLSAAAAASSATTSTVAVAPAGLSQIAGALIAAAIGAATVGTVTVLLLRFADRRRERWALDALRVLRARGEHAQVDRRHHLRGLLGGRPGIITSTLTGRGVIALSLFVPLPDADPELRPSLNLPPAPRGHRVGGRMVQLWQDQLRPAAVPALLAEGLSLAHALEEQATAPWASFAARAGLRFRPNRGPDPCALDGEIDGVPVHVHLEGLSEGPLRTVLLATAPRPGAPRRAPVRLGQGRRPLIAALAARPLSPTMLARLNRHPAAQVDEDTVQIKLDGMVTDELDAAVTDLVALARLFGAPPAAPGRRGAPEQTVCD